MIYDPSIEIHRQSARERIEWLISKGKTFEVKEVRQRRSVSQNSYMHLIFSWFALQYGETERYVKQVMFKRLVNEDIFKTEYANKKTGEIRIDWRSTSDLNTKELTTAIERFRDYSSKEAGIYLPEPSDMASLNQLESELKRNNNQYL